MSGESIAILGFIVAMLVLAVFVLGGFFAVMNDYSKSKEKSNFKGHLKEAIINSQPTWKQVRLMASTRPLTTRDVSEIVRELLSEALGGGNARLKPHIALIESFVDADTEKEPFEDMPQEIRIHLQRLRDQLPNRPELFEALVNHLRDVRTENLRRKKRQALINVVSLIVGLAGLIVGVLSVIRTR